MSPNSNLIRPQFDRPKVADSKVADFTVLDQAGKPWRLSEHLDAAAVLVFLRGDW